MAGADGDERKSSKKIVVFSFYLTLCGTLLLTQLQYSKPPPPFLCFSLQAVSGSVMSFKMAPASCVLCFLIKKKKLPLNPLLTSVLTMIGCQVSNSGNHDTELGRKKD